MKKEEHSAIINSVNSNVTVIYDININIFITNVTTILSTINHPSHQHQIIIISTDSQQQCSLKKFTTAAAKDFLSLAEEHLGITSLPLKELFSSLKTLYTG